MMPKADEPPVAVELKAWPFNGYAPGNYTSRCHKCVELFDGDKRAVTCLECAVLITKEINRHAPQPVGREASEAMVEAGSLPETLRERASYLRAFIPEGLSQIEKQSMEVMDLAANELDRLNLAIRSAYVTLNRDATFAEKTPDFLLHVIRGGRTQDFDAALSGPAGAGEHSEFCSAQVGPVEDCSVCGDLTTQIARLLADDPICGGRVARGTIEAIARLSGRPAGGDAGITDAQVREHHRYRTLHEDFVTVESDLREIAIMVGHHYNSCRPVAPVVKALIERLSSPDRFAEGLEAAARVDSRPDFPGDPVCKIAAYNDAHEDALEMGYPSLTEALEHLDELRTTPPIACVLAEAVHDRLFGVAAHDDPVLALREIKDGGGIHEAVHELLRALPAAAIRNLKMEGEG